MLLFKPKETSLNLGGLGKKNLIGGEGCLILGLAFTSKFLEPLFICLNWVSLETFAKAEGHRGEIVGSIAGDTSLLLSPLDL
jgi:hypothetical protein